MKIFVIALKAMGIALLCLLTVPLLIFIFFLLPSIPRVDSQELVHSQAFQHLHQLVYQLDHTRDIVVQPKKEYIVIDKLAINLAKRTFGSDREHGIYQSDEASSEHKFSSLDSLLAPQHLDSTRVYQITAAMKTTHVVYVEITYKVITYRWQEASWWYDEEGILYEEDDMANPSQYRLFEAIAPHFYHYAR
ncbi:hypothetical protein EXU85_21870 [Spirosoma sp. KCTC 42546]|uniref:hypothetical protein n=1 Tax=Spirosoma sp. KCTC 42546 TaxID=2520506 RepID=UPI001158BD4C|nr:hypothetical protein [Spirosoma sp. KCTC 42546]QDK81117.1 hypothetical protein EXU85_21870 [Spirosoma sp. KCTC 42546]